MELKTQPFTGLKMMKKGKERKENIQSHEESRMPLAAYVKEEERKNCKFTNETTFVK
jgi:hypothetical protein